MHFDAPRRVLAILVALVIVLVAVGALLSNVGTTRAFILMATTTSTRDTGLLSVLLPGFQEDTGIEVRYVAVGTGQALDAGRRGDVDVVMVHAPPLEDRFLAEGHGVCRNALMFNRFIIVGPVADPANVAAASSAVEAFQRIAQNQSRFESRADNSGTHVKELEIWNLAGLNVSSFGVWYERTSQGMGATLTIANERDAYTLSDDGTWFAREGALPFLRTLYVGSEPVVRNDYSIIPVNPAIHPTIQVEKAVAFARWLVGVRAQGVIASFAVNGHRIFTPNPGGNC
ncbi:MAG TPA: substrate-binding domain-containing protein [Thermoplasmata archaeon]